jgi:peptidoglycan pentaglycine glycine transferase (the first glycine)
MHMQMYDDLHDWNRVIATLPEAHLLQTQQWAKVKSQVGWQAEKIVWGDPHRPRAAALILLRTLSLTPLGPKLRVMYVPKGPLLQDWADDVLRRMVLDDLIEFARRVGTTFLKIDPDVIIGLGIPGTAEESHDPVGKAVLDDLAERGFHFSDEQIQFRNTLMIDLRPSEEELLAQMKQKTRYNIRLAGRKGVTVRCGTQADFSMLYQMYAETSLRDGFTIRNQGYYLDTWEKFMAQDEPSCQPLIAEVQGEPVAAVMIFHFSGKAYYLHGMSGSAHRNKMPNYLLQWEAIKFAKSSGCTWYDLWGAPSTFDESDSMWGVFRFKRGLGGQVIRTIGAYDLPLRPNGFILYSKVLPRILALMRRWSRSQTHQRLG